MRLLTYFVHRKMTSKRHSIHPQASENEEAPVPFILALLLKHKQKLFYLALALIAVGAFSARSISRKEGVREHDFLQAQANLHHLLTDSEEKGNLISQLEETLHRHSELHAKYDGPLAQAHINGGDVTAAKNIAASLFQRNTHSHYATFSKGSLLIAEGQLAAALDHAVTLKEELHGVDAPLLRAHNLLRIALLQGEIGTADQERLAWEELLDDLARGGAEPLFMQAFTAGSISMADYADARLHILTS